MHLVTIGTDVEFVGKKGDKIIPLTPDLIDGDKHDPYIIYSDYNVGVQLDNILGELTFAPADSAENFEGLCAWAELYLHEYMNSKGLKHVWKTHHTFKEKELLSTWAKSAGCERDFPANKTDDPDAYPSVIDSNIRTCSGHLHFGLSDRLSASQIIQYVRGLDFVIGAPLMLAHNDHIRRRYYGQAGRFRFKDYGFEYRTPDSWWFSRHNYMATRIYNQAEELFSNRLGSPFWKKVNLKHVELCAAINTGDKDKVKSILAFVGLPRLATKKVLPKSVRNRYRLTSLGHGLSTAGSHPYHPMFMSTTGTGTGDDTAMPHPTEFITTSPATSFDPLATIAEDES